MKIASVRTLQVGLVVAALAGLSHSSAHAQFNIPKVPKIGGLGGGSTGGMSAKDLESSLTTVKASFVVAMSEMLTAHAITLQALGKKEDADKFSAEAKSLSQGDCDSGCMKRTVKVSEEASAKSQEAMSKSDTITAEGKAILATAVPPYARGTAAGAQLPGAFASWVQGAQSSISGIQSNPAQALSAARLIKEVPEIAQVSTSLPGLVSEWSSTSANFSKFAKKNGVDAKDLDQEAKKKF